MKAFLHILGVVTVFIGMVMLIVMASISDMVESAYGTYFLGWITTFLVLIVGGGLIQLANTRINGFAICVCFIAMLGALPLAPNELKRYRQLKLRCGSYKSLYRFAVNRYDEAHKYDRE